ncbi:MAG TPA: outer membrane beta-barrel protein [Bryobacteraceae bacterium]|nr:outer membrane beta-barrel protein [Bryobacteraceae bacterium]
MFAARTGTLAIAIWMAWAPAAFAQDKPPQTNAELAKQVGDLAAMVERLQARVDELEAKLGNSVPVPAPATTAPSAPPPLAPPQTAAAPAAPGSPLSGLLGGTTVNFVLDGYYGFNFNNPVGRVNLLRAYDVSSNAFSLNQADVVLENAADPDHGKRYGLRVDLQFGQATATLQGSASSEPRPDIYRNVFQAYGTYVFAVGGGLTVDFGKWASSLGMEGNYTKDQINYSRSLLFDYLPFYHMGARANYKVNQTLALNYWLVNGTEQTEPFNGFKDQLFGFVLTPNKSLTWTVNYYLGQEHPDVLYLPGYGGTGLPSLQGTPFETIPNPPQGKLHIFDTYLQWQASKRLSFAWEGDYVVERLYENSAPQHVTATAGYARYQLTAKFAFGARTEYISDRGGLFTGVTQAVKEQTFTAEEVVADGLLLRAEWRRDASNQPYFLTSTQGILKREQNTATLGIVWWFGGKQGAW